MGNYIWLFPILFIVHDMEEIIGFGPWIKRNKEMLQEKYPRICKTYEYHSTEGMAVAVFEELLLCIAICIAALVTGSYYLWMGGFVAYTLHLLIHIIQSIAIHKYIPALITSIVCLPISIWIIWVIAGQMSVSVEVFLLYSLIGSIIVAFNLKFALMLMSCCTKWLRIQR